MPEITPDRRLSCVARVSVKAVYLWPILPRIGGIKMYKSEISIVTIIWRTSL